MLEAFGPDTDLRNGLTPTDQRTLLRSSDPAVVARLIAHGVDLVGRSLPR